MSKLSLWCVLLGFLAVLNMPSVGAEPSSDSDTAGGAALKIGVVNVMSLIEKSSQGEQARKTMEREFKPRETKLNGEKEEITKMRDRLAKDAETMSEDEQKKQTKELLKRIDEVRGVEEKLRRDFNETRNEEMAKLQKSISEAIESLAREEHFDLILSSEGVPFAAEAINVTAKVASRLENGAARASAKPPKK
ncbi:MAG: OmpH family outer membrane protein [Candidatus Methylumidiphilus sp.]